MQVHRFSDPNQQGLTAQENPMFEMLILGVGVALFALAAVYIDICERL
jgi:hypothetical protein